MELVKSLEEIRHNIAVLDSYLDKKTDPEYSYALGLVKRGICFIVVVAVRGYNTLNETNRSLSRSC